MMSETGLRRILPEQSSGSVHTFGTPRHPSVTNPILSKRVSFYKSGDPQFSGHRLVINNRTFKTFDALLDSLSKKVPLPFGVRNITTPRGVHAINSLDQLEDGKSYICSDRREVKPINLAVARKKLPPWYNARPVSSRRRTVQQARSFPGWSIHKPERVVVRKPKRLLVFRNGDPAVKHTVVLHKKTMPSYEAILGYMSELMLFHVVKLCTPDGKRVEGLPGLILCSGVVVAVGREPFRPAVYSAQISPAPTRRHTNRMTLRGQRALNHSKGKKKSLSYVSKSRNFSPSSERYIVHQIHNSIAGSSRDIPSHLTNSVELESIHKLESVAETEEDTCLGDGADGQGCMLPSEDDIEKSFRVNQDGSMTVEMKVRLTIKEEETVHWTTTLSRSSVANQLSCLPEPESAQEICSPDSNSLDLQSPASSVDVVNEDNTKDNNDEDPPSLSNGASSESRKEENEIKNHSDLVSPTRPPTAGHIQISKKQASVESIKSVTANGIQEGMVGSYCYREQTGNGTMTEQYCMVKQSSTRPVPKPRRLGSVDANSRNVSAFKSAGMAEILQIESSGEEVTETVLHLYEQQTCLDNFVANAYAHDMAASGTDFGRPATTETGQLSSYNEFEPELWRPSTASESISIWRAESMSVTSDLMNIGPIQATNRQQPLQKPTKGQVRLPQREVGKDRKVSPKAKVINKHVRRVATPIKRQKEKSPEAAETRRKVKTFSSAGFLKRIYGNKSKSAKSMKKFKKRPQNGDGGAAAEGVELSDDTVSRTVEDPNIPSVLTEGMSEKVSSTELSQPRVTLTRQTSMHREEKSKKKPSDISESMSLPAFNSSSSVTNKYVENWLEKAHLNQQTENGRCGEPENKHGSITGAEEEKCSGETSETCQTSQPTPESLLATSVKLRVQSFENKSSSPSAEKTTPSQQNVHNHTTTRDSDSCKSSSQQNVEEMKPLSNGVCSEIIPPANKTSEETPLGCEVENKSSPVRISLQKATPFNTLSMELPSPPPPEEYTELSDAEYCAKDISSVASSPLYRSSSQSSQMTDNHPSPISPTSDKAISPTDNKMETTSFQSDIHSALKEAPLTGTPPIKRALVSNLSLERKMSLRKACVDEYTLSSGATSETATLPAPISTVGDDALPNGISSTVTQQPTRAPPEETEQMGRLSGCTSVSPTSLTSEEGTSSASISSSEASVPSNLAFNEAKLTQKEASSPKTLVKKAKPVSSPSPERKSQHNKSSHERQSNSSQLSSAHRPLDKTVSPNVGTLKQATPERKPKLYKPKSQKRPSPYSQSLDMVSPPVRHKSSRKLLSSDDPSTNRTQRRASAQRTSHKTPQPIKSTAELAKALTSGTLMPLQADQSDEKADLVTADQEKSNMPIIPQPSHTADQPSMKPVLEKICYSIKSIRQITQNKRPSCLEKSNSLPDFSSHVASTFGSSSKALLAFLSVMTLKEGVSNLNMEELNVNDVSCAEALKMIDSLREIASIEDSQKLKSSLSNLQQSASKQLLQSWKGFQELGDRSKSRSSTPNSSERDLTAEACPEQDTGENVIDDIMDNLDMPETLKEELASLSAGAKRESDTEETMSAGMIDGDENANHSSPEDALNVQGVARDDKANVDVRAIIKKFTEQEKPPGKDSIYLITETGKLKAAGQPTQDNDDQYEQTAVAKYPPAELIYQQPPGERPLHSKASLVQENKEDLQSCKDAEHQDNQAECRQLQMQPEESISMPENEFTHEDKSGSDEEGPTTSSAIKDLAQGESCKQSACSSEGEQQGLEEDDAEASCEEIEQESSEGEDLSSNESRSEEEENESNVDVNVRGEGSSPEEEQRDAECKELSNDDSPNPARLSNSEKELQSQACGMGLNVSDESTESSDASSEEALPEVAFKELQVIVEESLSGLEEEQEAMEEDHFQYLPDDGKQTKTFKELKALIEESEEDKVSSEGEDLHTEETQVGDQTKITGGDLYASNDSSSLMKSESVERRYTVITDDSGNDHSSCEEHVDEEQPTVDDEHTNSSIEEEISYYEKEFSTEEEANVDRYVEESRPLYQEAPSLEIQTEDTKCGETAEKLGHRSEEIPPQSVAERVILLEKQAADAQKNTASSATRCFSQRNVPLESDVEESSSESSTSPLALCTRSAPQSSLSFSYDSSGVITTEPEGNRVRSIREMFLAKSATDIQQSRFPSPNSSQPSESRADTSGSGGYQSQTSSELSSAEDDSARKSITKGFVRRTIERLYGKKDANPDKEAGERPPSEQKQKEKEHSTIFSPFHAARSKAMSELSYFNSTNALDTLSEATRCIAFNAQVGPGDSVPIDDGRWLLRDNTVIRKSVSDPVGIYKSFTNTLEGEGERQDAEENPPYSLFSSQPDQEDETFSRKCTYFSLPHASDSDACQDDTASKSSINGDTGVEANNSEDAKMWAERNGKLPAVSDFKMMDNKVHPLVELPPGEVVVVQPGRGHGVVNRRQEPDALDLLYNFCGQHCPIL